MNKEYTYIDGKVIISDENNNKTQCEYYDNLDEVLVQENLIETMENNIEKLEKESKSYKRKRKHYIPWILILTTLISVIGFPNIFNLIFDHEFLAILYGTSFGKISYYTLFCIITDLFSVLFAGIIELFLHSDYKEERKNAKGIISELNFLKKQIEIEKEKLNKLKQEKSRKKENTDFRTVNVDDKNELDELDDSLNLYYDLGYNDKKYYHYYQQGKLNKKLQKYYSEEGLNLAKEYLEEKGPTLSLRKKK